MSKARKALMQLVSGDPVDVQPFKPVPRQFADDFDLAATHYRLKELGEYEEAKRAARADLANAITTYAALANQIKGETA